MRVLEFVAFRKTVSTSNKQKINSICGVKDKIGFTCFDWFELNMNNALKVRGVFERPDQRNLSIA